RGGEIEEFGSLPDLGGVADSGFVHGRAVPLGYAASVAEQHPNSDLGCGREAIGHVGWKHAGQRGIEREAATLDELQHGCGDERLHDAPSPEAITGADGDVRMEPTE